jgi:isopentenyl-diphosphate delta-isomerase
MRTTRASRDLILVDAHNRVVGYADARRCHDGGGVRHRALSVFLFNSRGEVLLQRRSTKKRLWPGFWSNSCCSHPRRGESVTAAARRRLREELGVDAAVRLLFRFEYQAAYGDVGAEHELCAVLVGSSDASVRANPDEVAEWRFVAPGEIDRDLRRRPSAYTPWMHLEWRALRSTEPGTFFRAELGSEQREGSDGRCAKKRARLLSARRSGSS